jgi:hypothetical protein
MPGKSPGPSIKNPTVYEALRKKGYSKEKAAAISNAMDVKDRNLPLEVKAMPAAARSIFKAVFNKSLKEEPEDMAALLALGAVKKKFEMVGEEWVKKEEAEKAREAEIAEALSAVAESEGGEGEGNTEGGEGEGGNGKQTGGGGTEKSTTADPASTPSYTKKTKTTETTETRGSAESESTGDSVALTETLMLDAAGFRLTGDGYLVTTPRVARTGIQIYKGYEVGRPDMEDVRVYRPEDEVFSHAAMATLAHRPITLDHPFTSVDATNWKEYGVGHSSGDVARDGDYVRVPLVLMDAHAIAAAQSGTSQLSVGYDAKLKWGAGQAPNGQLYDAMQTEIRANHIALVSKARGGDKLKIGDDLFDAYEDGGDDYFDREFSTQQRKSLAKTGAAMPHGGFPIKSEGDLRNAIRAIGRAKNPGAAKAHIKKRAAALGLTKLIPSTWGDSEGDHYDGQQRRFDMTDRVLNIDGVSIALDEKDGQILERHLKALNASTSDLRTKLGDTETKSGALTAQVAELTKALATKDGEIAALNKKVEDGKVTPAMLDEYCRKRMDIVERAVRVLGDKYTFENKPDTVIRREVVATEMGDAAIKDWADDKIEGAFNYMTKPQQQDGFRQMAQSFSRPPVNTNINDAAAQAYNKRNDDLSSAWKRNKGKSSSLPA